MERDNLTEEATKRRIASQLTNTEYVSQANVVFSTQWEPEYTQKQVNGNVKSVSSILVLFFLFFCRWRKHG